MSATTADVPPDTDAPPAPTDIRGNPVLRAAGWIIAMAFRAIPERLRFRAALAAARRLAPAIRRTRAFGQRAKLHTDNLQETSLELLLMMLTRHGTTFTPNLRVEGVEHLPPPGTGPILVVSAHTMLSFLFLRYLEDAGYAPSVIAAYPDLRISGMRRPARVLLPSPSLLLKVRSILAEGRTLTAMIDRDRPERRTETLERSGRTIIVSAALLQLALHQGARIVFLSTRMDDESGPVSHLSVPSTGSTGVSEVLADFVDFIEQAGVEEGRIRPRAAVRERL